MKTVRVVISGRVQGVGFRASLRDEAVAAGVAGWCRNTPGGDVEALLSGSDEAVDRVLQWCAQGPSWAAVDQVSLKREPVAPEGEGFRIVR